MKLSHIRDIYTFFQFSKQMLEFVCFMGNYFSYVKRQMKVIIRQEFSDTSILYRTMIRLREFSRGYQIKVIYSEWQLLPPFITMVIFHLIVPKQFSLI